MPSPPLGFPRIEHSYDIHENTQIINNRAALHTTLRC